MEHGGRAQTCGTFLEILANFGSRCQKIAKVSIFKRTVPEKANNIQGKVQKTLHLFIWTMEEWLQINFKRAMSGHTSHDNTALH